MASVLDYLTSTPKATPDQEIGVGGFTAMVRVRETYKLSAEVPVSPVENGSFANDHIILKPLTLTIEGSVSDVIRRASPPIRQLVRLEAEIGNITSQYAPARTVAQLSRVAALVNDVTDAVRAIDNRAATGAQAAAFFGNQDSDSKTPQEQFLDVIEAYHFARSLIAIDMPFRRHGNMVVTAFTKSTDNQTDETTFSIEAQQLQFAELQFVAVQTPAPGLGGQIDPPADKGTQAGEPVESSFIFQLFE